MSQRSYFFLPQLIPREGDRLSRVGGARLGSEELNQDRNSLFPKGVCVWGGALRPGGLWGCVLLPHTHQLVWSPLYPPGTVYRAGMEWTLDWEEILGISIVLGWRRAYL